MISQIQAMMEKLSAGFSHEDNTQDAGTSTESLVQEEEENGSPAPDVSSALGSISMSTLDFKRIICSVLQLEEETPPPFDDHDKEGDEIEEQATEEKTLTVSFQSKYVESFPLYQDYCLHQIREDMHKLNKSFLSELIVPKYLQGLQETHGPGGAALSPRSHSAPALTPPLLTAVTLHVPWQDLNEVKASGLLDRLTPKEICHQESIFELIGSEASYLRSLGVAVNHFSTSKDLKQTLSHMEHHVMFSNIRHVMAASKKFLMDLETRLGDDVFVSEIGDVVLWHCAEFQRLYVPYVTNMMYQEALVNQLMRQNRAFVCIIKQLESDPVCERKSLKSFLVLPFQRITRLKLILQAILKRTKPDCSSVLNLNKAIDAIHQIVKECDNSVLKMKRIEELIRLEQQLDFGKVKAIPLVTSRRFLMHQGPMKQLNVDDIAYSSRPSLTDIYLHLFNDLLIISSKSRDQRFTVKDYAKFPTHVRLEQMKAGLCLGLPAESVLLHLTQNHAGHPFATILVTESGSEKEVWLKALSSKVMEM